MVLPWSLVLVTYTVESKVELGTIHMNSHCANEKSRTTDTAIRAVGTDGKTKGDRMFVKESARLEGSTKVTVDVDPGIGEGGIVEITRLVAGDDRVLAGLEGGRFEEIGLVPGGWEGEGIVIGGEDELGLTVRKVGVDEREVGVKKERDVDCVKEGREMIVVAGKGVGVIVRLVKVSSGSEEVGSELGFVIKEDGVKEGCSEDEIPEPDGRTIEPELEGLNDGEPLEDPIFDVKEGENVEVNELGGSVRFGEVDEDAETEEREEDVGLGEPDDDVGLGELDDDVRLEGPDDDVELEELDNNVEFGEVDEDK